MDEQTIVKTLTNNMRAIAARPAKEHPEPWFRQLAPRKDEPAARYRERALKVIGKRWKYAPSTVRAAEEGRRPGTNCPQLLDDLQRYGAVRFAETGELIDDSVGAGPSPTEYMRILKDNAPKRRAVRSGARA